MAVVVIIRRTFEDHEKAIKLAPLIVKWRSLATIQPGYIKKKTLRCLDCPGEFLVLSTWNTIEDWQQWLNSDARRELQGRIDDLLGKKTEYNLYSSFERNLIELFIFPQKIEKSINIRIEYFILIYIGLTTYYNLILHRLTFIP